MSKSPAFQFYPGDWLGSMKIMLMKPEHEGAYIRLLAIAWGNDDCGLPDNDDELAVLSRLGEGWLKGGSVVVRKCFFSEGGRLYNKRLLEEREKQKAWREKSSSGGVKSGKVRRAKKLALAKGGSQMVGTKREPNTNTTTTSSSSSSKENSTSDFVSEFFTVKAEDHNKYCAAYQNIEPVFEYPKMVAWLTANPSKAKKKQWGRFVNNWLSTQQKQYEEKNPPESKEWRGSKGAV